MLDDRSCVDQFVAAVGTRIAHVTPAQNLTGITAQGLLSAAMLAQRAGIEPGSITMRQNRLEIGTSLLTHQRPLLQCAAAAERMLEDHNMYSWAAQLDMRVFFWPERKGHAFAKSIARDVEVAVIWLDAARFAAALTDHIDLAPINTGNFCRSGAKVRRGDWIYSPLRSGLQAFRSNRQMRGLKQNTDIVTEISIRSVISPGLLRSIRSD